MELIKAFVTVAQRQKTPIIYLIYFLIAMGESIALSLPVDIFKEFLVNNNENKTLTPNFLGFYPTIARFCASIMFGFVSDKFGRKIVLNICLLGSVLPMILYGFTKSYYPLVSLTVILSIFRGGNSIIKVLLAESNSMSSRPIAFSYFHAIYLVTRNIVIYISASFSFSNFIDSPFSNDDYEIYIPFLVSGLIASVIYTVAFILSYYYLNETLTDKRSKLDERGNESINIQDNIVLKPNQVEMFGFNLSKDSLLLLISFSILNFISKEYSIMFQDWFPAWVTIGELNLKAAYTLIVVPILPIILVIILLKYDYIYYKISALKLFKASFPVYGILPAFSFIVNLVAKTENTFIAKSLYAIFYLIERGFNTLSSISIELLLTESGEISGNLGALFGIHSGLSIVISKVFHLISRNLSNFSIDYSILFSSNYNLSYFFAALFLIGFWLSSKFEITAQKNQEIIREHEY